MSTAPAPALPRGAVRRALADLRPGDRIYSIVANTGDLVELSIPLLVVKALHAVDPLPDSATAVAVRGGVPTNMHLYPAFAGEVYAVRERGYADRIAATKVATRQRGYATKGGHYYELLEPLPGYTATRWRYLGFQGAHAAASRYLRDGWIIQLDGRWYVTALPAIARNRAS